MHRFFYGNGEGDPDDDTGDDTSGGDGGGTTYSTSDPVPASVAADFLASHGLAIVRTDE